MRTYRKALLLTAMLLVLGMLSKTPAPLAAQGANCPALVAQALDSIEAVCSGLGRNETCYGYNRVDALFWEPDPDLTFNSPADRVPLPSLQTLATAPLDLETGLWGVAALHLHAPDLPQILPGQAVMFLLMGDTTLENRVSPEAAAEPSQPVTAQTREEVSLYTTPDPAANTLGMLPAGTRIQLVGQTETADWAEVLLTDGGRAWIRFDALEEAPAAETLPVTFGADLPPRYGPMQSFYFTTGMAGPACNEAPDALVIQSPSGLEVSFNVNDLAIRIGSTAAFTTVDAGDGSGRRVLVGVLYEGHLTIMLNGQEIHFTRPGQAFALTLNMDGLVDENSEFRLLEADPLDNWLANACQNAATAGLFERPPMNCDAPLTLFDGNIFELAAGFPSTLPQLGQSQVPPPRFVAPPAPAPPPFVWPQITRPATLTELVGGGSHLTLWTASAHTSAYRLEIYPDTTNLTGSFVSFTTTDTQYDVPLGSMPSREPPGWGYFMRVIPLNAAGQALAPVQEAPTVWVVRLDAAEPPPPPPAPQRPPPGNRIDQNPPVTGG